MITTLLVLCYIVGGVLLVAGDFIFKAPQYPVLFGTAAIVYFAGGLFAVAKIGGDMDSRLKRWFAGLADRPALTRPPYAQSVTSQCCPGSMGSSYDLRVQLVLCGFGRHILRPVDHTHAARSQARLDETRAEPRAWSQPTPDGVTP